MGDCAEHFVFPRSFFLFSCADVTVDCTLRKLCNLACCSIYSSIAAEIDRVAPV